MNYDFNDLITQAQAGEKTALEILIINNKKIIYFVTKSIRDTYNEKEDINQTGVIGLIKAIKTFDLSKNLKFSTYATRCIKNEIFMTLRKNKKRNMESSLDQARKTLKTGEEVRLIDLLEAPAEITESDMMIDLRNALHTLSEDDRRIIELVYFGDMTQDKVASVLGITRALVNKKLQRSLKSLKFRLLVI